MRTAFGPGSWTISAASPPTKRRSPCTVDPFRYLLLCGYFAGLVACQRPPDIIDETLTVTVSGDGSGTIVSDAGGLDCTVTCTVNFPLGSTLTLIATADEGSHFAGWSGGGCSGTGNCTVAMTSAQAVTATFTALAWDPTWSLPGVTYTNGNLSISGNSTGTKNVRTNIGRSSGKWYWEIVATGGDGTTNGGGLGILEAVMPNNVEWIGSEASGLSFGYGSCCFDTYWLTWSGVTLNGAPPPGSAVSSGVVYMFALDLDMGRFWAGQNGTWYNGGDPVAGAVPAASGITGTVYPGVTFYSNSINSFTANFGRSAFSYPVPAGFNAGF